MKILRSLRVSFFLATRSLWRGNLGVAVMTVGMLALIFVDLLFLPALIQGTVDLVGAKVHDTLTSSVVLSSTSSVEDLADSDAILNRVRNTNGVAAATATNRVGTQISHGDLSNVWTVDSIDPMSFQAVFTTPNHLIEGSYLTQSDTNQILLGVEISGSDQTSLQGYALSLKSVHVGDTVTVTLINGKKQDFVVKGIYKNDFLQADQKAFITQSEAQQLLPASQNRASAIYVNAKPSINEIDLGTSLVASIPGLKFQTSDELAGSVKDQINTFHLINRILKTISLVVAAITVFIVIYVDLVNRRKQIGIERAIGIKSSAIIGSYLLKVTVYAIFGIGLGAILFLFVAVPLVIKYPFHFPNGLVTLTVSFLEMRQDGMVLIVVTLVSAFIPAWRSVKIKILDAIWGI